ncbi:MAG: NADH-quinone oxidoreductase subunit N [Deltaproteobacteria bacterium]|nr:NADH-quinone oxidoreductase subunit N [Deltaproteobacteria bacterium]
MTFQITQTDLQTILPELILFGMGMLVLVVELFRRPGASTLPQALVALLGISASGYGAYLQLGLDLKGFSGEVIADDYAAVFKMVFAATAFLTVLISTRYLADRKMDFGEYYALLLFAVGGMMVMASALDLLMVFVGLEILSISSYILCGMLRHDVKSNESAMKYFLLGAFATGFLLYGMAMIYGATGTIHIREIGMALTNPDTFANPLVWFGMALLLVGFGFKLSIVPFHMWTPDVYEGAPTAVTAFLSAGPKAAGFAALIRLLVEALGAMRGEWSQVLWVLAALTMTLGNVVAIQQNNIKRMLAYSSIAHAGYILAALVVSTSEGLGAVVFYTLAYTLMNMGIFAVLILASGPDKERVTFDDFKGFGYVSPAVGLATLVFVLSLIGIPLTGGFVGKFQIFKAVVEQGYIWLAVIGVVNSVVSVYYYLRILVVFYMTPPQGEPAPKPVFHPGLAAAILVSAVGVLYLGILPSAWLELSSRSVSVLLAGF